MSDERGIKVTLVRRSSSTLSSSRYEVARIIGAVTVPYRVSAMSAYHSQARVGDLLDETEAKALSDVCEITVVRPDQHETST